MITGGLFEGERLSGEVLEGGSDWGHVRSGSATTLNVRIVLKTNDDALIGMAHPGPSGPPTPSPNSSKSGSVRSHARYFRIAPVFEICGSA